MKENLTRLPAIVLLLICSGASAQMMGQGDSVIYSFTDPHDPALGGDATLAIPPDTASVRVSSNAKTTAGCNGQTVDFQEITTGYFLPAQAGCYHFFGLRNLSPAICNSSPEVFPAGWPLLQRPEKRMPEESTRKYPKGPKKLHLFSSPF